MGDALDAAERWTGFPSEDRYERALIRLRDGANEGASENEQVDLRRAVGWLDEVYRASSKGALGDPRYQIELLDSDLSVNPASANELRHHVLSALIRLRDQDIDAMRASGGKNPSHVFDRIGSVLDVEWAASRGWHEIASARSELARAQKALNAETELFNQAQTSAATHRLSMDYGRHAEERQTAARTWTLASIGAGVLAVASVPLWGLVGLGGNEPSAWLARGVAALALLGLGAYFARIASLARREQAWASSIKVQLDSVMRYIAKLDDASQQQVLLEFSRRVFGAPPESKSATGESAVQLPVQDLISALIRQP